MRRRIAAAASGSRRALLGAGKLVLQLLLFCQRQLLLLEQSHAQLLQQLGQQTQRLTARSRRARRDSYAITNTTSLAHLC